MVFQNYALYPHMNVERNIGFPLERRQVPKDERRRRVAEVAEMLDLTPLLKRKPAQLSGGQRQRVAMGRALSREPAAFLLDEPLSNLDAKLRMELRAELKQLHARVGTTMIYVTHDQVEAMTLGDRIAVMEHGRLQQLGRPTDIYERPANLFVATFIGSPPMNIVSPADAGLPGPPPRDVKVGLRPEALSPAGDDPRPRGRDQRRHRRAAGQRDGRPRQPGGRRQGDRAAWAAGGALARRPDAPGVRPHRRPPVRRRLGARITLSDHGTGGELLGPPAIEQRRPRLLGVGRGGAHRQPQRAVEGFAAVERHHHPGQEAVAAAHRVCAVGVERGRPPGAAAVDRDRAFGAQRDHGGAGTSSRRGSAPRRPGRRRRSAAPPRAGSP